MDLLAYRAAKRITLGRAANQSDVGVPTAVDGLPVLFVGGRDVAAEAAELIARLPAMDGYSAEQGQNGIAFAALTSQKAALDRIRREPPKVVLVEVDGRPNSRVRFCTMIRYRAPNTAICAVRQPHAEGASAFDAVLDLPFTVEQMEAVLASVRGQAVSDIIQRGPIRLNVATRTVYSLNGQRHMTPKQCALLQMLMVNHDKVVSRSDIMSAIWETTYMADTRTLDVHIRWLRECIEPDPSVPVYLLTVRGKGYRLHAP